VSFAAPSPQWLFLHQPHEQASKQEEQGHQHTSSMRKKNQFYIDEQIPSYTVKDLVGNNVSASTLRKSNQSAKEKKSAGMHPAVMAPFDNSALDPGRLVCNNR
jgi:hypothetical protein